MKMYRLDYFEDRLIEIDCEVEVVDSSVEPQISINKLLDVISNVELELGHNGQDLELIKNKLYVIKQDNEYMSNRLVDYDVKILIGVDSEESDVYVVIK